MKFRCACYKACETEDYRKHLQPLNTVSKRSDFITHKPNKKRKILCSLRKGFSILNATSYLKIKM